MILEQLLKQFIQKFDTFSHDMMGFKKEMLDFKDDITRRLERIEQKLDATIEQVVSNSEDLTLVKDTAAQIADRLDSQTFKIGRVEEELLKIRLKELEQKY